MTALSILIMVTMITITLSNSLGLGYIEVQYFDIKIRKPDWCNYTSLVDYYYKFTELQNKVKYPCAQYV